MNDRFSSYAVRGLNVPEGGFVYIELIFSSWPAPPQAVDSSGSAHSPFPSFICTKCTVDLEELIYIRSIEAECAATAQKSEKLLHTGVFYTA